MCWTFHLPMCWASPLTDVLNPHHVLNTNKYIAIFSIKWGWSPLTYLPLVVIIFEKSIILFYWTPYRGIETTCFTFWGKLTYYWTPYRGIDTSFPNSHFKKMPLSIEPLIGGLILSYHGAPPAFIIYWTPYRGIEMLICLPWKGSGGGVVYGCGVWRVKSWVKNVPNTNKYIAIFPIKWGWSPLTYLPLVVIIFEKSIILFYWTPYRGIDTSNVFLAHPLGFLFIPYWTPYRGIDTNFIFPNYTLYRR